MNCKDPDEKRGKSKECWSKALIAEKSEQSNIAPRQRIRVAVSSEDHSNDPAIVEYDEQPMT